MSKFNIGDIVRVNDKSWSPAMIGRIGKIIYINQNDRIIRIRFNEPLPDDFINRGEYVP